MTMVEVTMKSALTGIVRTMDLPVSHAELEMWRHGNKPIQIALSKLTPAQREFLLTGITEEEWNEAFRSD